MNEFEELKKADEKLEEKIDKVHDNLSDRIEKVEQNVSNIDKGLGDRMLILETTYKLNTESINNKIDKLDRKFDKMIEKDETKEVKKEQRSYEWLKSVGLIVIGIIITYVMKKIGF